MKALIIKLPALPFPSSNKKISLKSVSSATFLIPLGALYVATYAREIGGHDVKILDLNIVLLNERKNIQSKGGFDFKKIVKDEIISFIRIFQPQVIGLSAIFLSDEDWAFYCAKIIKSMESRLTVLIGGSLAAIETNKVLACKNIDYAVLGEGELVFKNFLDYLPNKARLFGVKGLAFKDGHKIIVNEREEMIPELDSIPLPDFNLIPLKSYPQDILNRIYIFTGRGCPSNCTFCSSFKLWGRKVRRHSVKRILKEVKRLKEDYGILEFDFWDENFTINNVWLGEFCEKLQRENWRSGITLKWGCPAGLMVKTLTPDSLRLMHKVGCTEFRLAVESGSARVAREVLNKPIDYKKVLLLRDTVRDFGGALTSNFMLGMPGETLLEIKETINFIKQLDCDWNIIAIYTPIPGTELYEMAKKVGSIDGYASKVRSVATFSTKEFSQEDLKKIQYDANIKYNFVQNRNVLRKEKDLQVGFHIAFLKHVVDIYPKHIIAKIVLGYHFHLDGESSQSRYWWSLAKTDLKDPCIRNDFGQYLDSDEDMPVVKWKEFINSQELLV